MNRAVILRKLEEYTKIKSYSECEEAFISSLQYEFSEILRSHTKSREVRIGNHPEYLLFTHHLANDYLFVVHVDRVRVGEVEIKEIDSDRLQGQFDNLISIVVLYELLFRSRLPINILFTTKEEIIASSPQVAEVVKLFPKFKIVSLDIDVYGKSEPIDKITIRSRDRAGNYDELLVEELRAVADENKVPYTKGEVGWGMSDAGFVNAYSNGKIKGAGIGVPLYNYHSNHEIISCKAVEDISRLIEKLISKE